MAKNKKGKKIKKEIGQKKAKKLFTTDILDRLNKATKTDRGRTYTILGMTFITFSILVWFAIRPTVKTIFELNKKISQFKTTAQTLDTKYQALQNLEFQYENSSANGGYSEKIGFVDSTAVPSTHDLDYLLANIEAYAERSNLAVSRYALDPDISSKNVLLSNAKYATVQVSLSGDKSDILDWVEDIENYPRPLYVDAMTISVDTTADDDVYLAEITLVTFYFDPGQL